MVIKIKKILILLCTLILVNLITTISSFAIDNNINIKSQFDKDSNSLTVEVSCGQNLKEVKMYKKVGDKLIVFYVSSNINFTNKFYKIPSTYLSYDSETDIIVDATDEQGNRNTAHFVAPKIPTYTPAPTTSSTPSQSTKPSTSATPSQNPTPSQKPSSTPTTNQEIKLTIDKSVLMLDKHHYKFSILKATVSPSNATVTFKSDNTNVATVKKNSGLITAKDYGTANIIATAKLGNKTKTKTCKIRVITTMQEKTSDSGKYYWYSVGSTGWKDYYIRNYNPKTKKVTKNASWSNAEVESYINNAVWLVKTYPNKFSESKKLEYTYFPYYNNTETGKKTVEKPAGKLCMNSKHGKYILLFTTKNQWLYLLKKENGVWKVDTKTISSGGYNWRGTANGTFNKYIVRSNDDAGLGLHPYYPLSAGTHYSKVIPTNALHLGGVPGYPTSLGCIHLGNSINCKMAKRLKEVFRQEKCMIKIIYY